jgi:hypothetical protein
MKDIKLNKVTYSIPSSWREVTVRQQMIAEALTDSQTYVKSLGVLSAYTNIPMEIIKHTPTAELTKIMSELEFINTPIDNTPIFKFTFKGEEYSVGDTLLNNEFQDYVAGQTAMLEYKDNNWKQLSYLVAIMAKKEGETLDSFDLNKRAEYFLDLDVQTINQVAFFLSQNQKTSDLISVLFSPEIIRAGVQSKLNELDNSLNQLRQQRGKNLLIRWWIWTARKYMRYISSQWEKSLNLPASNNSKKSWKWIYRRLLLKKHRKKTNN